MRAEIGLARAHERRSQDEAADRFEREDLAIHENRRNAFLRLAQKDPQRCKVIDASQSVDEIAFDIWQIVEKELLNEDTTKKKKKKKDKKKDWEKIKEERGQHG